MKETRSEIGESMAPDFPLMSARSGEPDIPDIMRLQKICQIELDCVTRFVNPTAQVKQAQFRVDGLRIFKETGQVFIEMKFRVADQPRTEFAHPREHIHMLQPHGEGLTAAHGKTADRAVLAPR